MHQKKKIYFFWQLESIREPWMGSAAEKGVPWPLFCGREIPHEGLDHLTDKPEFPEQSSSGALTTNKASECRLSSHVHLPTGRDDAAQATKVGVLGPITGPSHSESHISHSGTFFSLSEFDSGS